MAYRTRLKGLETAKTTNSNNSISRVSTKSGEKLTEKSSVKVSGKSSANGSFKNSEIVSQIEGGFQTTDADTKIKKKPIFKATPDVIEIPNFTVSRVYKMKFTIQNVSDHTKSYQVNGPKDPAFSFRILDKSGSSLVRPGLNVPFEVTFAPTEPRDYYDNIVIITEGEPVLVKLNCYRDKPILELPDLVNLGSALVYSTTTGSFTITNHGGIAFFSLKSTPYSNCGKEEGFFVSSEYHCTEAPIVILSACSGAVLSPNSSRLSRPIR